MFAKSETTKGIKKIQHSYNSKGTEFSQNLEFVAQKISLLSPSEVLDVLGRKSKFEASKAFIFSAKWVPIHSTPTRS